MLTPEDPMRPRMLALSLALVALGAGAQAAESLPKAISPVDRQPAPAVRRAPRGKLPKAVSAFEFERHRYVGQRSVR